MSTVPVYDSINRVRETQLLKSVKHARTCCLLVDVFCLKEVNESLNNTQIKCHFKSVGEICCPNVEILQPDLALDVSCGPVLYCYSSIVVSCLSRLLIYCIHRTNHLLPQSREPECFVLKICSLCCCSICWWLTRNFSTFSSTDNKPLTHGCRYFLSFSLQSKNSLKLIMLQTDHLLDFNDDLQSQVQNKRSK